MKIIKILFLTAVTFFIITSISHASSKVLKIGLLEISPFVFKKTNKFEGLSVKFWEEIAKRNKWEFKYTKSYKSIEAVFNGSQYYARFANIEVTVSYKAS